MLEREQMKSLIVATLDKASGSMRAVQLYGEIQSGHPEVLRRGKLHGFRSFVNCINQFDEIVQTNNSGIREYSLAKKVK